MSNVGRDSGSGRRQRSRREFLRVGVSVLGMMGLAAACAPAAPATKPAESKPAEPAKPAAAAQTTAPTSVPAAVPTPIPAGQAAPAAAKAGPTGTLNILLGSEPPSLDIQIVSNGRITYTDNFYDTLVSPDPTMKQHPSLAESWERIDPLKMRFKLRKGVKFQDGTPFTSEAVVLAVKRLTDPEMKSQLQGFVDTVQEATAVDDNTVDVITKGPDPILVARMSFLPIFSPTALKKDPNSANTMPIGTGPFRIVEWTKGQQVKLTAFDEYWGPNKPTFKDVVIGFRKEASVRVTALKAGEAHLIDNLTPELAASLPKDQVVSTRSTETMSIRFNSKTGITTDLRVRQAVAYSIDRESIVKDIYQGFGEMANGQIYSDLTLGFDPNIKDYPFDLEKAKQLVKEAGVEGQEFVITGATANRWLKDREIMEAVGAMISKTGLKANVKLVELADANNYFYEVQNPVVQASFTSPSSDLVDADRVLANYAKLGGRASLYSHHDMEKLFETERAELDNEKRGATMRQMSKHIWDNVVVTPIAQPHWIYGTSAKFKFQAYPTGQIPMLRMQLSQ
jgi:peptide/nickel transport system substrate-binding protein